MDLRESTNTVLGVEIAEGGLSRRGRGNRNDLTDIVFSWSLHDISNENLYRNKVETIPETFQSVQHYLRSYVYPLLEETRASLCLSLENISSLPFAEVTAFVGRKRSGNSYTLKAGWWSNESNTHGKETYKTLPGDILILTNGKPATVSDLESCGRRWVFASVRMIGGDNEEDEGGDNEEVEATSSTKFKSEALLDHEVNDFWKPMYAIFLINIATNRRIWKALRMSVNLDIVKNILCTDLVADKVSNLCITKGNGSGSESFDERLCHDLNESQKKAVGTCLNKLQCENKPSVELIWGPPGTGKTKTVATLLYTLLKMKHRTIVCAPTIVAIKEVASRVLKLLKESDSGISSETESLLCYFGDMLIFGNKELLKVDSDIKEIYLEHRVDCVDECFSKGIGWHQCLTSMIDTLANSVSQYHIFLEIQHTKRRKPGSDDDESKCGSSEEDGNCELKSFLEFFRDRFNATVQPPRRCLYVFCTHISRTNFHNIISLLTLLDSFEILLFGEELDSEKMEMTLSRGELSRLSFETSMCPLRNIYRKRQECLSMLLTLLDSLKDLKLPKFANKKMIADFCYQHASLIFCTASSSYKLYSVKMEPPNLLVIDEAAQLKECESVIPLKLPGVKHLILVGDECQLPAMVESKVSRSAGFGRSLFERLSSLGYSRQLLNMQYRMHPSISLFPTTKFYQNQILDGANVKRKSYRKNHLSWPMFGPYSFINIPDGREQKDDDDCGFRNSVEVEVISRILGNLHRAWEGSEEDLTVGVISPYAAQVAAVQDKLGKKYENIKGFMVKVKLVDGFQGGEEDIVIISTVRSNSHGTIGLLSDAKRTSVALTRARYCLWILGNGKTLTKSKSVWKALVDDAKSRECFFNVDDDKDLAKAILDVMKENNQLDVLLDKSSVLFRNARWKVLFSDNFLKSFRKLTSLRTKISIIEFLSKLSSGWRPKKGNVDIICEHSSHIVRQFKAEGLYVLCTIDIGNELTYTQILKIWDVLPLEDVAKLVKRLDSIFETYSDDFIRCCNEKCIEGDQEVPKTWVCPFDFIRYRSPSEDQFGISSDADIADRRLYAENAKVSESLLLMKFYPLSSDVVRHLLDDSDGKQMSLPFEVTEQEKDIILFPKSTFILGRSGTGKTTVLTMKLFRNEKLHDEETRGFQDIQSGINHSKDASLEFNVEEIGEGAEDCVLRQLFVTVSAKLCSAVKQHISQLRSSSIGAKDKAECSSVNEFYDDAALFKDTPDSFVDISPNSFPLIITFRKLLMMLDGTVGVSFFQRFPDLREFCHGQSSHSRPVALQSLLRAKEVTYEKFCAVYWPHFNDRIRRSLDPSRVFTEIMSHIKGGLQPADCCDGKLDRLAYVSLSEGRVSTLSIQRREEIYDAFEDYEKIKVKNVEFDLADFVNDLHRRLFCEQFAGNMVDFVYIDEVQDLTMRQISLFKYICRNVDEGFVFSGDTAQTIARGIDFRFEDIRYLFYKEFLMDSVDGPDIRMEKGCLSETFQLSQNFGTHAGILKLGQSVIDLLYHSFPLSIDALSPETSFIIGEAPILLESENDESAILSIFANSDVSGNFIGFGAEQVILVRDDHSRNEVSKIVRGQALILTIEECKGLEFQDVLLYNFFGTSPLKSQWRVIYGYMKEQALLDNSSQWSSPSFDDVKHNILCSELKQLYVAITRTRQSLWICENALEFSKPMFDYWKKKCLIQVRLADQALVEEMQVESTPKEWKLQGFKLLREGNYPMATICFERAGYEYGEKLAKASALKADADLKHVSSPQEASDLRRQAAEVYEAIGVADSAAECFYMLKEYEKAGRIFMEKCGESALEKAGECFSLAGRYSLAAEAYARGNIFSKCLSICAKGELFEMGLQYIEDWRRLGNENSAIVKKRKEIEKLEQDFLESCALHYYDLRDYGAMMKCVKAFHSIDSMRNLLMRLGCLDELISLEEHHGNFSEAAKIVRMKGDRLGESRQNKEASMKEYEKAGRIYMEKCGESALEKAGECFSLAGRYSLAAEAYARGNIFSKCLSICAKGELFEMGLQYIEDWRRLGNENSAIVKARKGIEKLEQDFLESCALHYYDFRDYGVMMKCVKAFHSIDSMRNVLMRLGCLDELISLEEDHGNFSEAANIVRMKGDRLGESRQNKEASMKEYEKAGRIYMEKCGESALEKAGECFSLAGRYSLAAEAYARGNIFSKCLSICAKGKFFEMGLQYIDDWKRLGNENSAMVKKTKEIEKSEQDFLESCALHYYDLRDYGAMMKYVKAFHCIDSMRNLLMRLGCLDELIILEEDYGNFLKAAKIVRMKGDIIREVDLLMKSRENKEASMNILWYVLFYSLWAPGSKGWPLKQFPQKEELLARAKNLAKPEPIAFYEYVCVESSTLLDKQNSLAEMKELLSASRRSGSVRGEILCARNILDFHLLWNISYFCWEYDWLEYSEQQISRNQISVDSLFCFWNLWKEKIVRIIECVGCAEMRGEKESRCCWEFCLNYFGVLEQRDNLQGDYHLLNADADWVRNIDKRFLQRNGQLVALELEQLVSAAQKYWYSELTSVGMKLLHKLDALYNYSVKSSLSNFWESRCLALLHEVANFLRELNHLNASSRFARELGNFIETSSRRYFGYIYPLDWRTSSTQNMISLRGSEASRHLMREMMNMRISKTRISQGKMAELATLILGSGMLDDELYRRIVQSFEGNTSWKAFMECVYQDLQSDLTLASDDSKPVEFSLAWNLYRALADTCKANWRIEKDFNSPICFLYLLERLLILLSCSKGKFYAARSSLAEWLMCYEGLAKPRFTVSPENCLEPIIGFVTRTIQQLLCNKGKTIEWIKRSNLNVTMYYPLLVLKLVLLVCLLHLNFGIDPYFLVDLLGKSWISKQLPPEFRRILLRRWRLNFEENSVGILAEAFEKIDDPLVITNSAADCSTCLHAIILEVKSNKCKEEIMKVLFPKDGSAVSSCKSRDLTKVSKDSSSSSSSAAPVVHLGSANTSSLLEQETGIVKEEEKSEVVEAQKTSDVKKDEQASSSSLSHTGVVGIGNKGKGNLKSNGKQNKKGRGMKK